MKKLTLFFVSLLMTLGMVAQTFTVSTSVESPEYQYFITNGNNVKMAANTAPTQNNPALFAFFETGTADAYKIYSVSQKKWVSYDKTNNSNNCTNYAQLVDSQDAVNAWKITSSSIKGGGSGFNIQPYDENGNVSSRYMNWTGGVGWAYSYDDSNTVGIWKDNAATDAGSGWVFTEVALEIDDLSNNKVYNLITTRGWLIYNQANADVVASTASYKNFTTGAGVEACQWAIYKSTNNKYYLYNVGADKFVGKNSNEGGRFPFEAKVTNDIQVVKSTTGTNYAFVFSTDNYGAINHFNHETAPGVANWKGNANQGGLRSLGDAGSAHMVVAVADLDESILATIAERVAVYEHLPELNTAITNAEGKAPWVGEAVGLYSYTGNYTEELNAIKAFRDAINENTTLAEVQEKIAVLNAMPKSLTLNTPATGKYYRLKNAASNRYMSAKSEDNGVVVVDNGAELASTIFYLEENNVFRSYTRNLYLDCQGKNLSGTKYAGTFGVAYNNAPQANVITYKNNDYWTFGDRNHNVSIDRGKNNPNAAGYNWIVEEVKYLPITLETGYYTISCGGKYVSDDRRSDSNTERILTTGTVTGKNIFYYDGQALIGNASGNGFEYGICNTIEPSGNNYFEFLSEVEGKGYLVKSSAGTSTKGYADGYWQANNEGNCLVRVNSIGEASLWTLTPVTMTATIGEKAYYTLADAVAAATSGQTITLHKNTDEEVEVPFDVTLNKNNFAADYVIEEQPFADYVVLPQGVTQKNYKEFFGTNNVSDGTNNYATMAKALEGIHKGTATVLYCKPGADLGTMTHGHVCRSLTIYGNGAKISGGEQDFELDTYKFCHSSSNTCEGVTAEVTLTVKHLDGCGAWGQRTTSNTLNIVFEDCKDMNRVYINGTTGINNITLTSCSFLGTVQKQCTLYSNANGTINVTGTTFSGIYAPVNLNHKVAGTQVVNVEGCTFTDCGTAEYDYAAPVRVLSSVEGAQSTLTVSNTTFIDTKANKLGQTADILLDYGVGTTNATVNGSAAKVVVENENNVGAETTTSASDNSSFTTAKPVAKIGEVEYMTLAKAVEEAGENAVITLIADVELAEMVTFPAGKTITLDLAGYEIVGGWNGNSTTDHIYALNNKGTLTIQDSKGNGSINSRGIYNYGSLTLNAGAINAIDGNGGYAVNNQNGSTFVMNGGVVAATYEDDHQSSDGGYDATALKVPAGCTATLNGGTINNVCDFTFAIDAAGTLNIPAASTITVNGTHGAIYVHGGVTTINAGTFQIPADNYSRTDNVLYVTGGSLVVNGGTFIGDSDTASGGSCLCDEAGTAVVNGGTFKGSSGGDVWGTTGTTIKGGTFENLIEKQHIAAGYELNADGTVVKKAAATINGVKYASIGEAVAALKSNETLVITSDITPGANEFIELNGKTNVTLAAAEGIVIYGNIQVGYHPSHSDNDVDRSESTFTVDGLTVEGTLTVCSNDAALVVKNTKAAQITVKTYREGMDIDLNKNTADGSMGTATNSYGMFLVPNATGYDLKVDSNTFKNINSHAFVVQGSGDGSAVTAANSIVVTNNKFESWGTGGKANRAAFKIWADTKYAPAESDLAGTTNAMRELVDAIAEGGNTYSSTADNTVEFDAYGAAGDAEDFPDPMYAVAKIGEQGYATLEEAFKAATEGQTITLLADATPALTSQRAITKAAVIDLGGKTLTLTEDDLYFGTTTFQNGTIVVAPSVKPSTAVFWMFANQTLTFDNVKIVATGVTGTYLIGLDGNNSDLNILNGSEILVENTTALDLDIICVNASTGNDIKVENSKVNVTNLDGRVFFRGNYTVNNSEVKLAGITKAGFRIEAGQKLSIEGTSEVIIEGEPRDGGIHLTDVTANYTKAETATVRATLNRPAVAKIGDTPYYSLAEAVAAAQNEETITLIADVTTADGVVITDKNLTIDLNGKTYTVTEGASTNNRNFKINGTSVVTVKNGTMVAAGEYSSGAYGTIRTEGSANVTLTGLKLYNYRGNGLNIKAVTGTTVTIENTEIYAQYGGGIEAAGGTIVVNNGVTVEQKGMYTAPYNSMAISVNGGGKVTVNGGTFSTECITAEEANNQGTSHGPWVAGVLNSGGTLIINGGTFSNDNFGDNSLATAARGAILADTKAKVEINGGTFNVLKNVIDIQNNLGDANNNPSVVLAGGTYNADPRISAQYGSNLITLAEGYQVVENNGVWTVEKAAAKIGTTAYATLDEAVKVAQEGDKITLLADAELLFENKNPYEPANNVFASEIDLNGKTLTIKKGDVRFNNTTIKNGNIIVQPGTYNGTAIFLMYSKNLTLDAVKVTATGVASTYLIGLEGTSNLNLLNGSEIAINNESLVNIGSIIADNGNGNTVTIKDSKIEITNSNARLYLGGTNGNITVENSDIDLNNVKEGFYLRAGQTLAITGTSTVDITLISNEGRYGINLTDITATYTKAETATVNATLEEITPAAVIGTQKFATLQAAIDAAVLMSGDVTIEILAGTYAQDINLTNDVVTTGNINARPNITFKAAEGQEVVLAGTVTLGYRQQNVGASMWNGKVAFEGITFDHAETGKHSLDIQDVKGVALNNCKVIGDGECGIGSNSGNATTDASFTLCTFENGAMQVLGQLGANLVVDNCVCNDFSFNVQGGAAPGMTIKNTTFNLTLTDAHVGQSFYAVRTNACPVNITATKVNVDSEVSSVAADQTKWAIFYARKDADAKWNVEGCEVNLTDAAIAQKGLMFTKNEAATYDNAKERIVITNLTSTSNEVADLAKRTVGCASINGENYKDGVVDLTGKVAKIGDKPYASLAEAYAEAKAEETITLLTDVTLTEVMTIEKAITLDLGGKTVTGADGAIVFNVKAATAINNGTVKGNKSGTSSGLIDIYANLEMNGVTVETTKIIALRFKAGGFTTTLENCNVTGQLKGYSASVWNIKSGTYKASSTSISEQLNGTAAVSGGTFHYAIKAENCAPGYAVVVNEDGTYTVKYEPVCFVDANNNGTLDEGEAVYGSLEAVFDTHKQGDVYVVLTQNCAIEKQVDTKADAKYYLNTNVAEGVTVDFKFADDWNYVQKMYIGKNVTVNSKHLLAWTDLEVYGTINTDYLYTTTAKVLVAEGGVVNANTGEATVQVKNGAELTVKGTVNTAILNVWAGESKLIVDGANAKVNAKWVDIWDGTPSTTVQNGATLAVEKIKASRGGSIAVADATLTATTSIELGHNGESAGQLTESGNSTVTGEIKMTAVGSTVTSDGGLNVTTDIADHKVVFENGQYKVVAKAKGSNSPAYTADDANGNVRVWGEGGGNARESFVLKLYSGETLVATSELKNVGGIIDGDVYVTWNFYYPSSNDEYWTTTWEPGQPNSANQPTTVDLIIDGEVVATTPAKMSGADDINPVVWRELGGVQIVDLTGEGTEEAPYLINNIEDLVFFRNSVNAGETTYNADGKYVALGADIDLTGIDWSVNIGDDCNATFDGIFDGQGKTIKNLTSTETDKKADGYICTGLFGAIGGNAVVKNFTIENVTISTGDFAGNNVAAVVGFAYNAKGSIENVHVTGDININAPNVTGVGAILGYDYYSPTLKVENCSVKGNEGSAIVGKSYVGGLVGYASSKIAMNRNTVENVSVTGTGSVGAIAGIILAGSSATNNTVKNVALTANGDLWKNSAAVVAGTITKNGGVTVENTTVENVSANGAAAALVGGQLVEKPTTPIAQVEAKAGNTYYATLDAALKAEGNDAIELLVPVTVAKGEERVLDLNGKTVTMNDASSAAVAMISNKGTLTITDNSEGKTGKLCFKSTTPSASNSYASNVISNYGTITIEAGTIENLTVGGACYALDNYAGSTANINGGKLVAAKTAVRIFNWTDGEAAKATINMTGGEIVSEDGYGINVNSGNAPYVALNISGGTITTNDTDYNLAVYVVNKNSAENFTADVTGGTFNGNFALNGVTATTMSEGNVKVSGGTFTGVICYDEPAYGFISGGTFAMDVKDFCAEHFICQANADGTYGVIADPNYFETYVIDDAEAKEYTFKEEKEVGTLTYKRTLPYDNFWRPLYVPFALPMSEEFLEKYDVAYFYDVSVESEGYQDAKKTTIALMKVTNPNAVLKANYPLVIRAKSAEAEELKLTFTGAKLQPADEKAVTFTSVDQTYEVKGTYKKHTSLEKNQRVLGVDEDGKANWGTLAAGSSLNPYRLILTITSRDDADLPFQSIGMRLIGEEGEGGITYIDDVKQSVEGGDNFIYDLQGRRVLEPKKGGIYIINGKKVYFK